MLVGLALLGCDAPGKNHKESPRRLVVALVFVCFVCFVFVFLRCQSESGLITTNVSRQPVCKASRHLVKPQDILTKPQDQMH